MYNSSEIVRHRHPNLVTNKVLFVIVISVSIPSVFINLFATYRLHSNTKLSVFAFRCILHVSLLTTCICVPCFAMELYFNSHFPSSLQLCKIWLIVDYSSVVCLALLVCWASIQRHILIFGPMHIKKLQSTLKFKLMPIIFAFAFPLIWYSVLISTCTYEAVDVDNFRCRPCFEDEKTVFLIDILFSLLLPLSITTVATFLLLIRIIRLRFRLFRSNVKKWRRCKRLTRQMILFSFIYLVGLMPYVLTNLNSLYNFWPRINDFSYIQIANTFTYVPCCFSSFLSIYAFPEIWKRRRNRGHQRSVRRNQKCEETSLTSPSTFVGTKTPSEA
ncbi:unnamed protein product [Adineta ricciae]|uniref:G-protein coupled receptors family 1 profile domain-containing protein n=1 Tax=Adineta ricciae TaxID=249248 RepID=A0A813Z9Y3_ADIRI|nr:unnamed protein product [Adineta ricciae]CAF0967063.1 unnamed protein product [Adineta ricciae]